MASRIPGIPGGGAAKAGAASKVGAASKAGGKGGGLGNGVASLLQGIARGLAAMANPATLIGLAAVVLAVNGIAVAIRIMRPAFEPIGKMFESFGKTIREVFGGLGDFIKDIGSTIEGIIGSIAKGIGDIIDKITSMKTAGTQATTDQIQKLSKIPGNLMLETAKGIDAIKAALDGFGGGTFSQITSSLFGGGGPIEKIIELSKKVPALMKAAEAIAVLGAAGSDFAKAEAELERRKKVAELRQERIGTDEEDDRSSLIKSLLQQRIKRQIAALEGQAMPISAGGGSGFGPQSQKMITAAINAADITMLEKERMKREASLRGGASGGGPTIITDARQSSSITTTGQTGNNSLTNSKLNGLTKGVPTG